MKPSPFTYHRPHSVAEAVQLLAELEGEPGGAKVIAGGQSLVPLMSMRLEKNWGVWTMDYRPDFTAADVYVGAQIGWGLQFGTMEERPGFRAYADRLASVVSERLSLA